MRTVPDTNVLIASLISRGFCHELLEYCFLNYTLVTSEFILDELKEKLVEKFKYSTETAEEAVALFRSRMQVVTPTALAFPVSRDPDDDNILATAVAGNCDCITDVGTLSCKILYCLRLVNRLKQFMKNLSLF